MDEARLKELSDLSGLSGLSGWFPDRDIIRECLTEIVALREQLATAEREREAYRQRLNTEYRASIGEVWHWAGNGEDHP